MLVIAEAKPFYRKHGQCQSHTTIKFTPKSILLDSMLAEIAEMGSSSTIKLFSNMFLYEESAGLFQ
jgi:hypothetical protein